MQTSLNVLAQWILETPLHHAIIASPWIFPAAETIHFMGLTLLFGALLLVDLRGMGFYRRIDFASAHKLIPVALFAFLFILGSGLTFIFADPERYFVNIAFQIKIGLVLIASLNALAFEIWVFRPYNAGKAAIIDAFSTRFMSGLSLLLWVMVLILGRSIPYVEV
jgi:hypothetical protein